MKILHRLLNSITYTAYFILLLLFFPFRVYAACPTNPATFDCLEDIYTNILHLVLAAASIAFFVMLLGGGIKWLTSSGDPKDLENAKGRITFAAFGIFLMILAWFILKFISEFSLGPGTTDILQFQIPK